VRNTTVASFCVDTVPRNVSASARLAPWLAKILSIGMLEV